MLDRFLRDLFKFRNDYSIKPEECLTFGTSSLGDDEAGDKGGDETDNDVDMDNDDEDDDGVDGNDSSRKDGDDDQGKIIQGNKMLFMSRTILMIFLLLTWYLELEALYLPKVHLVLYLCPAYAHSINRLPRSLKLCLQNSRPSLGFSLRNSTFEPSLFF